MRFLIAASGPSLAQTDLSIIPAGWKTITVNNAWKVLPNADYHYAGDLDWWQNYIHECNSTGERWTWDRDAAERWGINLIKRKEGKGLCVLPGYTHHGGNSGFQAINLAYHLGAKKIVLVGFDMSRKHGAHFDGDHKQGMKSAPENHIPYWRRHMGLMARDLSRAGIECINASVYTELTCFKRMNLADAL